MKLLNYGSLNIDHTYQLEHLIRPGETIAASKYSRGEGGKGFNQAIALARAGLEVYMAGAVGRDGLFLLNYLKNENVNTDKVRVLDEPTGHAVIQVDADGNNSIIIYGGSNRQNTADCIEEALRDFSAGDGILLQNEINMGEEILRAAAARGLQVILNPSPVSKELLSWPLDKVNWMILNEIEGYDLTGEEDPQRILDALLARLPACRIVLTLGTQGAWYADKDKRLHQPAMKAKAVDSTAAGDTFTGYFLSAALRGIDEAEALRLAAAASAIAVSRPGAASSIPRADEVLPLLS